MYTIGIDPGFDGAIVVLSGSDIQSVQKMPFIRMDGGRDLDYILTHEILRQHKKRLLKENNDSEVGIQCYLEEIPDGWNDLIDAETIERYKVRNPFHYKRSSAMKLAKQFGALCMGLTAASITYHTVMPRTWQAFYSIHSDNHKTTKQCAMDVCLKTWGPGVCKSMLTRPKGELHDGKCDAALIAQYGYYKEMEKGTI